MSINWYPGHMHKARKEILEVLPKIDVIIEIVDARIPYSSENPVIAELKGSKPCIKLLSKADLADPEITLAWKTHLNTEKNIQSLAINSRNVGETKQVFDLIRKLAPNNISKTRKIQVLVVGIPNVGKSTLINALAGRSAAKVGNEPAVTKAQQQIHIADDIVLNDTPGILWPKVENPNSGYRLAVTGAIRDTAIEYEDIALYAIRFFAQAMPEVLAKRYQIDVQVDLENPDWDIDLLEAIGKKRRAKAAGGRVNFHKAAEILIHDYRSGGLGNLTLETPEMKMAEEIEVARVRAEKAAALAEKKALEKQKRSGKRH